MKLSTVLNRSLIAAGLLLSVNAFAQNTNANDMPQQHAKGCVKSPVSCEMPTKKATKQHAKNTQDKAQKQANKKFDKQTAKDKRMKRNQHTTSTSKRAKVMDKADMSGMSHPAQ